MSIKDEDKMDISPVNTMVDNDNDYIEIMGEDNIQKDVMDIDMKEQKECLTILCHGAYNTPELQSNMIVPYNIRLIKYSEPGDVFMSHMLSQIEERGCKSHKTKEYVIYILHKNGEITKDKSKPRIIEPNTKIQNLLLDFKDDGDVMRSLNFFLGFYKNNDFGKFQNSEESSAPTIKELGGYFKDKEVDLDTVLQKVSDYISQTYGSDALLNVHQLTCHADEYINPKKITGEALDDLIEKFDKIDIHDDIRKMNYRELDKNPGIYYSKELKDIYAFIDRMNREKSESKTEKATKKKTKKTEKSTKKKTKKNSLEKKTKKKREEMHKSKRLSNTIGGQ